MFVTVQDSITGSTAGSLGSFKFIMNFILKILGNRINEYLIFNHFWIHINDCS